MIEVVEVRGLATVQDAGRRGHMHEGVPPGGALVPELLARANAAVRNVHGAAAIELFGSMSLHALASIAIAADDGEPVSLGAGDTWTVPRTAARVRYVAVRGGVDVPSVLGGRGTLLVAAVGGYFGRALRAGDRLPAGDSPPSDALPPPAPDVVFPVLVVPGPDIERFDARAVAVLVESEFAVDARSDRTGTRLAGPALPRVDADTGASAPMLRGAIQVPASGQPIVLGPDHPTTGGYPVIATIARASLGAFGARPVGATVRFALQR